MALTQISTDGIKNGTITGSDLATNIDLVDNQKIRFGTGNDLEIYHDGTHSRIYNSTNNLIFRSAGYYFNNAAGTENMLDIVQNGAVSLYFDNSKKFETTSTGAEVFSTTDALFRVFNTGDGTAKISLHNTGSADFRIENTNAVLTIGTDETSIKATDNGSVELYHNNSKKFETTSGGASISNNLSFPDNGYAMFGAGNDLQIYHSGTDTFFKNQTGSLNFFNSGVTQFKNAADNETLLKMTSDGAVELYHDNVKTLETENGGIAVTDDDTTTYVELNTSGGIAGYLHGLNNSEMSLLDREGHYFIKGTKDGSTDLFYDNSKMFETTSVGASIPDSGNQTASSTHTTGALFCNLIRPVTANNNSYTGTYFMNRNAVGDGIKAVGIVETGLRVGNFTSDLSATEKIKLTYDGHIEIQDNGKLKIGSGADLEIYHSGTQSFILNNTGNLILSNMDPDSDNEIHLRARQNEQSIVCKNDGAVELYHDNVKKMETTSVGVTMNDTVITNGEIRPASDNNHSIGRSNRRYITYFGVNSPVNTSDKNEKNTIIDSDLGLDFINKLKPISYKWNKDDGKTHYGLIAQDLEETLTSLGKTIADFGGIYKEDDSPMGLGYSELIAPLIKAVQELSTEVAALKAA